MDRLGYCLIRAEPFSRTNIKNTRKIGRQIVLDRALNCYIETTGFQSWCYANVWYGSSWNEWRGKWGRIWLWFL